MESGRNGLAGNFCQWSPHTSGEGRQFRPVTNDHLYYFTSFSVGFPKGLTGVARNCCLVAPFVVSVIALVYQRGCQRGSGGATVVSSRGWLSWGGGRYLRLPVVQRGGDAWISASCRRSALLLLVAVFAVAILVPGDWCLALVGVDTIK